MKREYPLKLPREKDAPLGEFILGFSLGKS
jgi:hypothetical protein